MDTKNTNGAMKMVNNGQSVPTWFYLLHSLDALQGQQRLYRKQRDPKLFEAYITPFRNAQGI